MLLTKNIELFHLLPLYNVYGPIIETRWALLIQGNFAESAF